MIIFGKQVFFYILQKHKDKILKIYLAKKCGKNEFRLIEKANKPIEKLDFLKAQALAKGRNHQGFLMSIKDFSFHELKDIKNASFLVLLHELSDVGNIGAIARTAYALGVDALLIERQSLEIAGIIRTSSGALLDLPLVLVDTKDAINELRQVGFKIRATCKNGEDIRMFKRSEKELLILGSEGYGLSEKIIKKCDSTLSVPLARDFDSLNVSSAFAVLCDRIRK